jgi:uncharacterized linocin/CFP29 family protein
MNLGREALIWSPEIWARLDQAVQAEVDRTGVAGRLLPTTGPLPGATTVPANVINPDAMSISETAVLPLVELSVEFQLTQHQVEAEAQLETALTLATRSANLLAQAEDLLIFQGDRAAHTDLFNTVRRRGSSGRGLVASAELTEDVVRDDGRFGEQTVEATMRAYARLQANSQNGPFALVLRTEQFADALAPLAGTRLVPAERLRPLVSAGLFGSGAMPDSTGLLMSLGGASVDILVGVDPVVAFLQVDGEGLFHFRVFERFAARLKQDRALVRLSFQA